MGNEDCKLDGLELSYCNWLRAGDIGAFEG
jgi:hypothetical protein